MAITLKFAKCGQTLNKVIPTTPLIYWKKEFNFMGSFNLMFLGTKGFPILHNNGLFHQLDYQDNFFIFCLYLFIAYFLKHNLWQHTHGWIGVSKSCSKYLTWQCIEFCIGSKKVFHVLCLKELDDELIVHFVMVGETHDLLLWHLVCMRIIFWIINTSQIWIQLIRR